MNVVTVLVLVSLHVLAHAQGNPALADYWERQKRYALENMDAAAREKSQCRTTYRTPAAIQRCEASQDRWHHYWNERYMEASREYEKYR